MTATGNILLPSANDVLSRRQFLSGATATAAAGLLLTNFPSLFTGEGGTLGGPESAPGPYQLGNRETVLVGHTPTSRVQILINGILDSPTTALLTGIGQPIPNHIDYVHENTTIYDRYGRPLAFAYKNAPLTRVLPNETVGWNCASCMPISPVAQNASIFAGDPFDYLRHYFNFDAQGGLLVPNTISQGAKVTTMSLGPRPGRISFMVARNAGATKQLVASMKPKETPMATVPIHSSFHVVHLWMGAANTLYVCWGTQRDGGGTDPTYYPPIFGCPAESASSQEKRSWLDKLNKTLPLLAFLLQAPKGIMQYENQTGSSPAANLMIEASSNTLLTRYTNAGLNYPDFRNRNNREFKLAALIE